MSSEIPKPDVCPKCGGSGWEPADGMVRRCACMSALRIERLLAQARIPKRYEHCSLDSYMTTGSSSTKKAKYYVQRFIDEYPLVQVGLLFLGTCGVGKTHLAVSLLKQVIIEKGDSGIFYDFRDLLRDIQDSWNTASQSTELEVLRPVLDAKILVLDELGANKPTEWVRDTIAHIINCRYNEKKITIFTSNYLDKPAKQGEETLTDRIGARLRSRLFEMCSEVEMQGEDFRQHVRKANFIF